MIQSRYLWVGGEGVSIQYDISAVTQNEVNRFKGHGEAVTSIHEHEQCIVTSSVDSSVKVTYSAIFSSSFPLLFVLFLSIK